MQEILNEVFDILKKKKFIEKHTDIPTTNGILARVVGAGTSEKDKRTKPTVEEIQKIKAGLKTHAEKMIELSDKL